jgi:hypothetical protein
VTSTCWKPRPIYPLWFISRPHRPEEARRLFPRLCCKTLFGSLKTNFPSRGCGDRIIMWGSTPPCVKLTGDSGNGFEAALIGDCRLFRLFAENYSHSVLGLLQHNPLRSGRWRHQQLTSAMGPTPDSCTSKLRPHSITSSARLTHATGGSGWSADSVSKIMKRPGRVCLRDWIAAALAAGKHVPALPRNEMNSFRTPQRTTPLAWRA